MEGTTTVVKETKVSDEIVIYEKVPEEGEGRARERGGGPFGA